ncbi:MAG TPA: helix-turn-helix transcriptional regulator [Egibacteraceae bacterium]|nr:helix-turn-helix transcriptional regulator [Egibacteraceae bacterium]
MNIVDVVILAWLVLNMMLFVLLGSWGIVQWMRCASAPLRQLGLLVAVVCAAFVLGSVQRLALQAYRLEVISPGVGDLLLADLQLVKSMAATGLAGAGFALVYRVRRSLGRVDRMVAGLTDRVALPKGLDELRLTPRELEVLALIGGGWTTDEEIAAQIGVSPATSRTHVRNLLRKAGLRSRRELILLAHAVAVE